jgi:hypothetical protein
MRKHLLLTIAATILSFASPFLKGDDAAPVLPAGEPLLTLNFPAQLEKKDVSLAVSKALVKEKWENLAWAGDVTSATIQQRHINIKVFVVANTKQVKIYALHVAEDDSSEEKGEKVTLRYLDKLEEAITKDLHFTLYKGRGRDGTDVAS